MSFGGRTCTHSVRADAAHRLDRAEVRSAFIGFERVVVELAAVVDAAHPGPLEELVGAEDLEPEVVDRLDLGEEPVAADVEAPAVALDGAADPADDVVGLEHRRRRRPAWRACTRR